MAFIRIAAARDLARHVLVLTLLVLAQWVAAARANEVVAREALVVTSSASRVPYSYLDANGEPAGMIVDVWRLFAQRNDVEITFKLVDWRETFDLVRNGTADVHGGLTVTDARRGFLVYSDEILRVRTMLFAPVNRPDLALADIEGEPVGVIEDSAEQAFLEAQYPDLELRLFADSDAMVEAAIAGDLIGFIADYPTGQYRLLQRAATDRFQGTETLYTSGIHPAVRQGEQALETFVEAGLANLDRDDIAALRASWLIPPEPVPAWARKAAILVLAVLTAIALVAHYFSLKRAVRLKTAEMSQSLEALEKANSRLEELLRSDPLTGVGNRKGLYSDAAREIERARRYDRPISVAVLDLDHFKTVNDRYGHAAGDKALRAFASELRARLRASDLLARIGGDEFAILLPETDEAEAGAFVRRVLDELRGLRIHHGGQTFTIGASAGVAKFAGDASIDSWIDRADKALYKNKREGRDRLS